MIVTVIVYKNYYLWKIINSSELMHRSNIQKYYEMTNDTLDQRIKVRLHATQKNLQKTK